MKASHIAMAVAAGILALCCSAQADPASDRRSAERQEQRSTTPTAAHKEQRRTDRTDRREAHRSDDRENTKAESRKTASEDKPQPSMPIPIPGVG
ncbi:MAG: hypothetical protein OXQ90_19250 [Gammaproteobacteria bacterium]|nr:hypothetical protein [Gammaproteobacteria bacterium]